MLLKTRSTRALPSSGDVRRGAHVGGSSGEGCYKARFENTVLSVLHTTAMTMVSMVTAASQGYLAVRVLYFPKYLIYE